MVLRLDPVLISELRARIRAIERGGGGRHARVLPFAVDEIDRALPENGLPLGCLHEILGSGDSSGAGGEADGAAAGFCALLLSRLAGAAGTVLWCQQEPLLRSPCPPLYACGLAALGLPPERLIVLRARDERALLWAMEEGLRSPALSAVAAEARAVGLTASRRLQLAAEAGGGVTGFLLRPSGAIAEASAAVTRWRVLAAPSLPPAEGAGLGAARWRAELLRCRGGVPGSWLLEWRDATGDLLVVPASSDRPEDAGASRMAV